MRIVAEYIKSSAQLLIRLLSNANVVQIGNYTIDGTPELPEATTITVTSDNIKNGESHIYLTGYWPLPRWLKITLPDMSEQRVDIINVIERDFGYTPVLMDQPIATLEPIEHGEKRPGESQNPYTPVTVLPPEYPSYWVELSLDRTDPVRLGANMSSDTLVYHGGCAGRALSATIAQKGVDSEPYLYYAPVRLEGQFNNSLYNANFMFSSSWLSPYFDDIPDGWSINLDDTMSTLRIETTPNAVLPVCTLRYRQRALDNQNLTILTPPITNINETFQILIIPGASNATSTIQLKTEDGIVSSPVYTLQEPILALLPIGTHLGRVQIIWSQGRTLTHNEQVIQLAAPCSSTYTGGHSYVPTGVTNLADVLFLNNILFDKPWFFYKGTIRVDGSGDNLAHPISWKLYIGSQVFLQVEGGVLSSDFMLQQGVLLSDFITNTLEYKLTWVKPTKFKLSTINSSTSIDIPFSLSIDSIERSIAPLSLEIMGYRPTEGSSILTKWMYLPT